MSHRLEGRVCVVTGATSGIGRSAAEGLARAGATVAIVGRDAARTETTRAGIVQATGNERVETLLCDLSSQAQVRELAKEIQARFSRVHVLLNNAGGVFGQRKLTVDGLEWTLAVNHLAPFLLTNLLLDRLRGSAPARIITVSSEAHRSGRGRFDFHAERPYIHWQAYAESKLANVLFTREVARRLEGTGVTANCLHPGVVRTHFGASGGRLIHAGARLLAPFMRSPAQGADTAVWLATGDEGGLVSGKYFAHRKERRPARSARDETLQRQLWDESAVLVGLG